MQLDGYTLPKTGEVLAGRYRLEELIGRGGMGAVYGAADSATGRAVAIKWLLPHAAMNEDTLARFLTEARVTARIEHPNVISVIDAGEDRGAPFLVMERLRGESLRKRLKRGPMSPKEALRLLLPALQGVAEAHREGIIHRDLKPDNIFLCRGKDGSEHPTKVLDFGISKLREEEAGGGGDKLTKTGMAMGTLAYMSPEQLNAPSEVDPRFDVYAMGVVFYEALAGRAPYGSEGLLALVQQIASGAAEPIRRYAPGVPPELEAVVLRGMHVDPRHRYPSVEDFIEELEAVRLGIEEGNIVAGDPTSLSVDPSHLSFAGPELALAFDPDPDPAPTPGALPLGPTTPELSALPSTGPLPHSSLTLAAAAFALLALALGVGLAVFFVLEGDDEMEVIEGVPGEPSGALGSAPVAPSVPVSPVSPSSPSSPSVPSVPAVEQGQEQAQGQGQAQEPDAGPASSEARAPRSSRQPQRGGRTSAGSRRGGSGGPRRGANGALILR